MASTRISDNSGSRRPKTPGFSDSIEKPATNSEPYYVNIAGRDSIGSNFTRPREMRRMSQFQGRCSHDEVSSVRDSPCRMAEVPMLCAGSAPGASWLRSSSTRKRRVRRPTMIEPTDNRDRDRGLDDPGDVGRMETLC